MGDACTKEEAGDQSHAVGAGYETAGGHGMVPALHFDFPEESPRLATGLTQPPPWVSTPGCTPRSQGHTPRQGLTPDGLTPPGSPRHSPRGLNRGMSRGEGEHLVQQIRSDPSAGHSSGSGESPARQRPNIFGDSPPRPPDGLRTSPDKDPNRAKKGSAAWNMFHRFTDGIAGMMPTALTRRKEPEMRDAYNVAVDLLVLAFAVCGASPVDCARFSEAAEPMDCLALKRLGELANRTGLMNAVSGAVSPQEHAKAFLASVRRQEQPAAPDPRLTNNSGASAGEKNRGIEGEKNRAQFGKMGRSVSNLSNLSKLSNGDAKRVAFKSHGKSVSNMSFLSHGSRHSSQGSHATGGTDFSATSFANFNKTGGAFILPNSNQASITPLPSFWEYMTAFDQTRIGGQTPGPLGATPGAGFVMQLDLPPGLLSHGVPKTIAEQSVLEDDKPKPGPWRSVTFEQEKNEYFSDAGADGQSLVTYHSACDAVLGAQTGEFETVRADVVNLVGENGSAGQVRIEFRSQCLRTQNEWQRQLLMQQRSLVDSISTKLESTEQELRTQSDVRDEEKELLRGFRKIISRDVTFDDKSIAVELFIIESNPELISDIHALCNILELPVRVCTSVKEAEQAVKTSATAAIEQRRRNQAFQRSASSKSTLSGAQSDSSAHRKRQSALARQASSKSSLSSHTSTCASHSSGRSGGSDDFAIVQVVLISAQFIDQKLPAEWIEAQSGGVHVVLTSEADEFEEVGRRLFASGKTEIEERLRTIGIREYLLHPLTLEGVQSVVKAAMSRNFGHEYLLTKVIGRGTSGVVYRAKRLADGSLYALKEINIKRLSTKAQQETEQETALLRTLAWPTLMELVDAWSNEREHLRYLLMPLVEGGDLDQQIKAAQKSNHPGFPEKRMAEWLAQALHGLVYLHACGVLHRDLKPGNLLLDADDRVLQIADLGQATRLPGSGPHPARRNFVQGAACTPQYASPETMTGDISLTASDLWSTSASFYEVVTLRPLFSAPSRQGLWELISSFDPDSKDRDPKNVATSTLAVLQESGGRSPGSLHTELTDDITQLLRKDPLQRPTAAALASRSTITRRLRKVFAETDGLAEPQDHFMQFKELVEASNAAENLDPPSVEATYPRQVGTPRRDQAKTAKKTRPWQALQR